MSLPQPHRYLAAMVITTLLAAGPAAAGTPAAPTFSPSMPPMPNTGFVLVNGFGYDRGRMVFCEPKYGHFKSGSQLTEFEVVDGQCLPGGWIAPGTEGYVRAIPAQAYLDELLGKGAVEFVGVAPALTSRQEVLAVLYYREKSAAGQPENE